MGLQLAECFMRLVLFMGINLKVQEDTGADADACALFRTETLSQLERACATEQVPEAINPVIVSLFRDAMRRVEAHKDVVLPWVEKRLADHEASKGQRGQEPEGKE